MMRFCQLAVFVLMVATFATSTMAQGRHGRGPDEDFVVDREDFHFLLRHHHEIRRKVTQLEDGIRSVTESENKDVASRIQKHVAAMYRRIEHKRPIRRRDPLFAELFRHGNKIKMQVEKTSKGVRVTETSSDAFAVMLIKAHAKVVSGFVSSGFEEAHKIHEVPKKGNAAIRKKATGASRE